MAKHATKDVRGYILDRASDEQSNYVNHFVRKVDPSAAISPQSKVINSAPHHWPLTLQNVSRCRNQKAILIAQFSRFL